jgi:hypothetical protein
MQGYDWVGTLINWFPMLLIFGVWIWFVRRMQGGHYNRYQKECLDMQRRYTEALERIAVALEKRTS